MRREIGVRGDELASSPAHDRARGGLERHHRGAAHAAVEGELADVFAGALRVMTISRPSRLVE